MSGPKRDEVRRETEQIERGMAGVRGRRDAARALDEVARAAGDSKQGEVVDLPREVDDEVAKDLTGVAEIAARTPDEGSAIEDAPVDEAVEAAADDEDPAVRRGRDLLRQEVLARLGPLESLDTRAFLAVNGLPRSPIVNEGFRAFSKAMTGGHAWMLVPAVAAFWDRPRARAALLDAMPPLWLATAVVEGPVKHYFRRHRPFVSLVDAVVVGRKPGSYSFPSGHSAAAFAGAMLLGSRYPRGRGVFLVVAGLVGFSRVYLGAHYPGDVVTGGAVGVGLAGVFRGVLRRVFRG